MRMSALAITTLAVSAATALSAFGQETPVGNKPQLGIFADTMKMTIPGLEGIKLPPQAEAALGGSLGAQRMLRVHLWTQGEPKPASGQPQASLDIPEGLKLGTTLPLAIPKRASGDAPDPGAPGAEGDYEIQRYWGCGPTPGPGQPKVMRMKDLTPEQRARIPRLGARGGARFGSSLPDWTDASWPNLEGRAPSTVQAGAALPGKYALRSNYVSGVGFELPAGFSFLEPVSLSGPGPETDLSKAIPISWKPVPGALAYVAMAMGMKGRNAMVLWTSTDKEDAAFGGPASTEAVKDLVAKGVCMAPDHTQCTLPAGAFTGCQGGMVMVQAIGPSFTQDSTPSVRVQTRSMGMTMLGAPGAGFGVPN